MSRVPRSDLRYTAVITVMVAALSSAAPAAPAQSLKVSELNTQTHIHGLAVDSANPTQLLVATHNGLFRAGPDGMAVRVSEVQDFMGFNPHPSLPDRLFASGHPARGGNLGFIASSDGGKTWVQLAPGANGLVDFHHLAVSKADPQMIYGVYGTLQASSDGGRTWKITGPGPAGLISLAASAKDPRTLYAGRDSGIYISLDGGLMWRPLVQGGAATMVEVTHAGTIYAFVIGKGLLKAQEGQLAFSPLNTSWGNRTVLHLASDPKDPARLYVATDDSRVLASTDGGRTWKPFGG